MSQQNYTDFFDPRKDVSHPIHVGQVYEDAREGRKLGLIFLNNGCVVLRDYGEAANDNWLGHRIERRDTFEKQVGSDFYELQFEESGSIETHGPYSEMQRLLESYENQSGRKAEHKAEAIAECLDLLFHETTPDMLEPIEFEAIEGIGPDTAESLQRSGISVVSDVEKFSDDDILSVDGMGEKNLERLKQHVGLNDEPDPVEVDLGDVPGIGSIVADRLRDDGYGTDVAISNATDEEILAVDGMGQKNLEKLREVIA